MPTTTVDAATDEQLAAEKSALDKKARGERLSAEESTRLSQIRVEQQRRALNKGAVPNEKTPKELKESRQGELDRLRKKKNPTQADRARIALLQDLIDPKRLDRADTARFTQQTSRNDWGDSEWRRVVNPIVTTARQTAKVKKVDDLRAVFGMGPFFDAKLLQARVDPADGKTSVGWEVAKNLQGYRFGPEMGWVARAMQRGDAALTGRSAAQLAGMSVNEVMQFYSSMNEAELIRFQDYLMQAGLYEEGVSPVLGRRDDATSAALASLLTHWLSNPDIEFTQIISRLRQDYNNRIGEKLREVNGTSNSGTGSASDFVKNITYTDTDTLNELVDQVAINVYGQKLDPQAKANLVSKLQQQEVAKKTEMAAMDYQAQAAGTAPSELDAFMESLIQQESGGDPNAYNPDSGAFGLGQILESHWAEWAREAGQDPRDKSADNQRRIIRYHLAKYYAGYQNWRDVAVAWYGGPGAADALRAGRISGNADEGGYPTINSYADQLVTAMNGRLGQGVAAAAPQLQVNATEALGSPEARAAAELKRLDPARYYGTEFARQAEVFFGLINGVV